MNVTRFLTERVGGERYSELQAGLRSARMYKSPEEYIFTTFTTSILVGVLVGGLVSFLTWSFLGVPAIYLPPLASVLGVGCGYAFYRFSLLYPSSVARNRRREIDARLPHAVAFLWALSKGGTSPIEMMKELGAREDEYGEISKEAIEAARCVEYFGYSPPRSLLEVSETTPSEKLREFFRSFATVVEAGSGVDEFLAKKSDDYYSDARGEGTRSLDQIALFSELYVIGLGLGPFLLATVWIPVAIMTGISFLPVLLVIYLGIPMGSVLFLLMLDKFSIVEVKRRHYKEGGGMGKMKKVLSSPLRYFSEEPVWVLSVSIPIAASFAAYRLFLGFLDETTVVISILIILFPLIFFHERRRKRIKKIVEATPVFLGSYSATVSSGLTPAKALKALPPERFGPLAPELRLVRRDVEWGESISRALSKMEKRIRSGLLTRVVSVMERASRATARISDVLDILAKDVSTEISLKRDRVAATFTYVVIIYLIFTVTAITGFGMVLLSPAFAVEEAGGAGDFGGGLVMGGLDPGTMRLVFFHLIIFQALFMGMVAGKFRTGSILDGLKHSALLLFLGWGVFTFALPYAAEQAAAFVPV